VSTPLAVGCNCPAVHKVPDSYRGRQLEPLDWHTPVSIGSVESAAAYAIRRDREQRAGYPCCDHCDHQEPDYEPSLWRHDDKCPNGCNDGDGAS
jgi:hypothetical protein